MKIHTEWNCPYLIVLSHISLVMQIMITGDVITTSAQCYNKGDILFVFFIDWNFNLTEVLKSQGRDYHNGFQKKTSSVWQFFYQVL